MIVEGFRQAAKVAAEHGLTLGIEPLHRTIYGTWTTVYTDPRDDRADGRDRRAERAAPVRRVPPPRHRRRARRHACEYGSRISPSIHICDWRDPTRNDFDRVLPGDGHHRPAGHLRRARRRRHDPAWVDLEIFSDDGSFSDLDFEDSLWKQDAATCSRGRRRASTRPGRRGGRPPDGRLAGKVALVTGAARQRGIGRGMVQALADEGAAVAVNDIAATEAEGEAFVDELRANGVRAPLLPRRRLGPGPGRRADRGGRRPTSAARHRLLERRRRRLEDGRREPTMRRSTASSRST